MLLKNIIYLWCSICVISLPRHGVKDEIRIRNRIKSEST